MGHDIQTRNLPPRKSCISLLITGAMNPPHPMHIISVLQMAQKLEDADYSIDKIYLDPASMQYLDYKKKSDSDKYPPTRILHSCDDRKSWLQAMITYPQHWDDESRQLLVQFYEKIRVTNFEQKMADDASLKQIQKVDGTTVCVQRMGGDWIEHLSVVDFLQSKEATSTVVYAAGADLWDHSMGEYKGCTTPVVRMPRAATGSLSSSAISKRELAALEEAGKRFSLYKELLSGGPDMVLEVTQFFASGATPAPDAAAVSSSAPVGELDIDSDEDRDDSLLPTPDVSPREEPACAAAEGTEDRVTDLEKKLQGHVDSISETPFRAQSICGLTGGLVLGNSEHHSCYYLSDNRHQIYFKDEGVLIQVKEGHAVVNDAGMRLNIMCSFDKSLNHLEGLLLMKWANCYDLGRHSKGNYMGNGPGLMKKIQQATLTDGTVVAKLMVDLLGEAQTGVFGREGSGRQALRSAIGMCDSVKEGALIKLINDILSGAKLNAAPPLSTAKVTPLAGQGLFGAAAEPISEEQREDAIIECVNQLKTSTAALDRLKGLVRGVHNRDTIVRLISAVGQQTEWADSHLQGAVSTLFCTKMGEMPDDLPRCRK